MKTLRGPERAKAVAAAEALLVQKDVVLVPLLERVQTQGVSARTQGYAVNPFGLMSLRDLRAAP